MLLSEYVEIAKNTFKCKTKKDLQKIIMTNMPLMYAGVENMINRCSKFYGSSVTSIVEDDNIKVLFEILGVKKNNNTYNLATGEIVQEEGNPAEEEEEHVPRNVQMPIARYI